MEKGQVVGCVLMSQTSAHFTNYMYAVDELTKTCLKRLVNTIIIGLLLLLLTTNIQDIAVHLQPNRGWLAGHKKHQPRRRHELRSMVPIMINIEFG